MPPRSGPTGSSKASIGAGWGTSAGSVLASSGRVSDASCWADRPGSQGDSSSTSQSVVGESADAGWNGPANAGPSGPSTRMNLPGPTCTQLTADGEVFESGAAFALPRPRPL